MSLCFGYYIGRIYSLGFNLNVYCVPFLRVLTFRSCVAHQQHIGLDVRAPF